MNEYTLRLYIVKNSQKSQQAIANLHRICKEDLKNHYKLEIIDIQEQPQLAENEQILAIPTLIKELPLPIRKLVGDLSNKEKVLLGLDLQENIFPNQANG